MAVRAEGRVRKQEKAINHLSEYKNQPRAGIANAKHMLTTWPDRVR